MYADLHRRAFYTAPTSCSFPSQLGTSLAQPVGQEVHHRKDGCMMIWYGLVWYDTVGI